MIIDLSEFMNSQSEKITFEKTVVFEDSYLKDSEIKKIEPVTVKGECHLEQDSIVISGVITGKMQIEDAISLKNIDYPFSFEFEEFLDENLINDEKVLDITSILWQNIVLEVPLKQTEVTDFSEYQGDGWKLVTEEESENTNNPFGELVNMWGEE